MVVDKLRGRHSLSAMFTIHLVTASADGGRLASHSEATRDVTAAYLCRGAHGTLVFAFAFAFAPTVVESVRAIIVSRITLFGASNGFGVWDPIKVTIDTVPRPVGMYAPGSEDGSKAFGVGLLPSAELNLSEAVAGPVKGRRARAPKDIVNDLITRGVIVVVIGVLVGAGGPERQPIAVFKISGIMRSRPSTLCGHGVKGAKGAPPPRRPENN